MILSFIAQNRIHFKIRKKTVFPGFLLLATRNPGFKILPRIGNTICNSCAVLCFPYHYLQIFSTGYFYMYSSIGCFLMYNEV